MKSANCGNQVCVEHAPISQAGRADRMSSPRAGR
ncbi:MAG: hypothetical protein ACLTSX_04065 [Collinsella sp.]